MNVVCWYTSSQLLDDLICRCMHICGCVRDVCRFVHGSMLESQPTYMSKYPSCRYIWEHVYSWRWSFDLYVQWMNGNAEIVNRTEVYRFSIHRPQSRRWYEPCCYLYIILLHSSKFCSHVPFTTGNTSILAYMDDDVESIQVRLGHIHIYSANLAMMMVRRWRKKKSPSPKHKKYFDELLRYDYVYDWWWMQMSYRTEAYRISITSSRNSADRNVAVALTCTLLCYWRKSFTIDSSH